MRTFSSDQCNEASECRNEILILVVVDSSGDRGEFVDERLCNAVVRQILCKSDTSEWREFCFVEHLRNRLECRAIVVESSEFAQHTVVQRLCTQRRKAVTKECFRQRHEARRRARFKQQLTAENAKLSVADKRTRCSMSTQLRCFFRNSRQTTQFDKRFQVQVCRNPNRSTLEIKSISHFKTVSLLFYLFQLELKHLHR